MQKLGRYLKNKTPPRPNHFLKIQSEILIVPFKETCINFFVPHQLSIQFLNSLFIQPNPIIMPYVLHLTFFQIILGSSGICYGLTQQLDNPCRVWNPPHSHDLCMDLLRTRSACFPSQQTPHLRFCIFVSLCVLSLSGTQLWR